MSIDPLICARCGKEIEPGSLVEFISIHDEDPAERRIIIEGDDDLVVHKTCPEEDK